MKSLLLILKLFGVVVIQDPPVVAGWASVGGFLSANEPTVSNTTKSWAVTATLNAGDVGVCLIGKDEASTSNTDGSSLAEFTSVTDVSGNTWVEALEWCEPSTTTVSNGSCTAIYYTQATSQLNSGSNLTFNYSTASSKSVTCWAFSTPSGLVNTVSVAGTQGQSGLAAMTVTTATNRQHLFIRSLSCEHNISDFAATSGFTAFPGSIANSGTAASSNFIGGEWLIETATTSTPSAPTITGTTDCSSVMIALNQD